MGGGGWQDVVAGGVETQAFGCTAYSAEWARPDCPGGHFHAGIDIGCIFHDPVHTTRAGVVVAVGLPYLGPYAVCVETSDGHYLEFGHMDTASVAVGQRVAVGQQVGLAGTLGASTGVHVHLEARTDGPNQGPPWTAVVDPAPFLTNLEEDFVKAIVVSWPDGHNEKFRINSGGTLQHCYDSGAPNFTWSVWGDLIAGEGTNVQSIDGSEFRSDGVLDVHTTMLDGSSWHFTFDPQNGWRSFPIGV
jgi:hypothetical protein